LQDFNLLSTPFLQISAMKPKQSAQKNRQRDLFRPELVKIIDSGHGLVKLAKAANWDRLDEMFGRTYCPDNGRPAISTRLMVSLQYLKYTYNLSDDDVVAGWVENPYWQYLSGMQFFEHDPPINSSSMTRWRKRIGEAGAEELLKETIAAGLRHKVVKTHQLKRVNVDTTVQEKDIRFPADARLYYRARQRLVDSAKQRDIPLRQKYSRNAKHLLAQQSRYAHARLMKRARRCTRKLRTYLGRVIRDIERKPLSE
jgi:transposase, IS5 family